MSEQEKTGWQIASEWYGVDEIQRCIAADLAKPLHDSKMPRDMFSSEFAEWLTEQYRLAMAKGIQFGREHGSNQLATVTAEIERLKGLLSVENERIVERVTTEIADEANKRIADVTAERDQLQQDNRRLAERLKHANDEAVMYRIAYEKTVDELKLWKPMTPEEAEAELEKVVAIPIPDEEIAEMVAKITDPTYRPTEPQHVLMAAKIQQLEDLISHIWIHADMAYTINQMTSEQRELYNAVVDRQLKKIGI